MKHKFGSHKKFKAIFLFNNKHNIKQDETEKLIGTLLINTKYTE
jgi:hypothetical protein